MAKEIGSEFEEMGKRLSQPALSKDEIFNMLKQAASLFAEVGQSPSPNMAAAMKPLMDALVQQELLNHSDKEVRLLMATCISEIMRIVAPDAPYSDEVLKEIFRLIVMSFQSLDEIGCSSFTRSVSILEMVAKVKSCLLMLNLECNDLILEMFEVFFLTAREEHPQNVLIAMRTIMTLVIDESEDIPQVLLDVLLKHLLEKKKEVSPAAHRIAMSVFQRCYEKLEPYVQHYLSSGMLTGKLLKSELQEQLYELIYEIHRCAPQMLLPFIPNLITGLLTVDVGEHVRTMEVLRHLFPLVGQQSMHEYRQLLSETLKRLTDKAIEVQLAVVECCKECLLAKPFGPEVPEILTLLTDCLRDIQDEVQICVVAAICDLFSSNPKCVPMDIIRSVAEQLHDKKVHVRKYTLQRLKEVYRTLYLEFIENSVVCNESFDWIPMKILRCCFDKDCEELRLLAIESVLTEELFPSEIPVVERTKQWISIFSTFNKNDRKAFERILLQKQRLQHGMKDYLLLLQEMKEEDSHEAQEKLQTCCKNMSELFVDPARAGDDFEKLNQLMDNNTLKALTSLLDPNLSFSEAQSIQGELLKKLGENHPQFEFMRALVTKSSYMLFGREHVKILLNEIALNKAVGKEELLNASMGLLVQFIGNFPVLVEGAEEELLRLLMEDREIIKESVVQILAKASDYFHCRVEGNGFLYPVLEKLCLEGSRKQAKYAMQALVAIENDSVLKELYGKMVDLLELTMNLPTVLQSLGCIAQNARSIFEIREDEIIQFVVHDLFKQDSNQKEIGITDGGDPSKECRLKTYGLKALVRSFLPNKDAHLRQGIEGLLGVLVKVVEHGEISDEVKSSEVDKAYLRLAAAKGVMQLSRCWDSQISPQLFNHAVLVAQDSTTHVRHQLLEKTHQYLKDQSIPQKYACAFILNSLDAVKGTFVEAKQYMIDFINTCRCESRLRQSCGSRQLDGDLIAFYPEYVLFYLVHILAHHASFPCLNDGGPSIEAIEWFYKQLLFFLWALMKLDGDGDSYANRNEDLGNVSVILCIFHMLKDAEDVVDSSKSKNSVVLSDIGILITKNLVQKQSFPSNNVGQIPMPSTIYKPVAGIVEAASKEDRSHLPACLAEADALTRFDAFQSELSSCIGLGFSQGQKRGRGNITNDITFSEEAEKEDESPQKCTRHQKGLEDGAEQDSGQLWNASQFSANKPGQTYKTVQQNEASKSGEAAHLPDRCAVSSVEQPLPFSSKRKRDLLVNEDKKLLYPKHKYGQYDPVALSSTRPRCGHPTKVVSWKVGNEVKDVSEPCLSVAYAEDNGGTILGTPVRQVENFHTRPNSPLDESKGRRGSSRKQMHPTIKQPKVGKWTLSTSLPKSSGFEQNLQGSEDSAESPVVEPTKNPSGTQRKTTKKTSIAGLEKQSESKSEKKKNLYEKLVGVRIKVWWPLDKRFYEGIVDSYDPAKKKHKVIYNDGDTEVLSLTKEHWELVGNDSILSEAQLNLPSI